MAQCVTCGFENMPGSDACGRCGTSMRLATAVMDVQPPRAGKFQKRLRNAVPLRKMYFNLRDGVENSPIQRIRRPRFEIETGLPPFPVLWRMPIPGWPHFYLKHPIRGHLFLWSTLVLLMLGLLGLGTNWGSIFLGFAFSVHTSAALDAYNLTCPGRQFGALMMRSIAVTMYLGLLVYLPVGWLLSDVAAVRTVERINGPFAPGDVLLVNHSLHHAGFPRPGQVVMYEIPMQQLYDTTAGGHHEIGFIGGDSVDRVLATAGDKVTWDGNGHLTVNGVASALRPLNPSRITTPLKTTVPEGCVFILPSTVAYARDATILIRPEVVMIARVNVSGTVYLRTHPLERMQIIR